MKCVPNYFIFTGHRIINKNEIKSAKRTPSPIFTCWILLHVVVCWLFHSKNLSGTKSRCQTVWIQIILLVVIWIQTVCKCYQQMTKVAAGKEWEVILVPWPKCTLVLLKNLLTLETWFQDIFLTFSGCKLTGPIYTGPQKPRLLETCPSYWVYSLILI